MATLIQICVNIESNIGMHQLDCGLSTSKFHLVYPTQFSISQSIKIHATWIVLVWISLNQLCFILNLESKIGMNQLNE